MTLVKNGDTVSVEYTGRFADGTIFDSSVSRQPLQFTVGSHEVITGFDNAVLGLVVGETITVDIPPAEGYGIPDDNLIVTFNRAQIPPDMDISIGTQLQMKNEDGHIFPVRIANVTEEEITVDANHPLAGKDLSFEIKLLEICS